MKLINISAHNIKIRMEINVFIDQEIIARVEKWIKFRRFPDLSIRVR